MTSDKKLRLRADEIRQVAPGHGACMASDRITVDGDRVGYMYRREPDFAHDSGWIFLAGDEPQEYADDPDNIAIYDVNTIANYDGDIVPLLGSPVPSAFARLSPGGPLEPVAPPEPEPDGDADA